MIAVILCPTQFDVPSICGTSRSFKIHFLLYLSLKFDFSKVKNVHAYEEFGFFSMS